MKPIYFAECKYGRYGTAFQETDRDANSREAIVDLIRGGADVIKVLEVDEDSGTCRNVTDELREEASATRTWEDIGKRLSDLRNDMYRDLRKHEVAP